jgi:hypothetical protein
MIIIAEHNLWSAIIPSVSSLDGPSFLPTFLLDVESILNPSVDPEIQCPTAIHQGWNVINGSLWAVGAFGLDRYDRGTHQAIALLQGGFKAKNADRMELLRNTGRRPIWPPWPVSTCGKRRDQASAALNPGAAQCVRRKAFGLPVTRLWRLAMSIPP